MKRTAGSPEKKGGFKMATLEKGALQEVVTVVTEMLWCLNLTKLWFSFFA